MAVYAAHLTRTLSGTPSIFQVTAQEALGSTVKPALRKVFEYLSAVYPDRFDWSVRWYDELYLLLDGLLQYHYLKHYSASFSESFYGLVRVPLKAQEFVSAGRLPPSLERGSWLLLVLMPYIRDKVEELVEKWRQMDEDGLLGKTCGERARRLGTRLHSWLHGVLGAWRVVQLGAFVSGAGRCPAPGLRLLGLALAAAPPGGALPPPRWGLLLRGRFAESGVGFPLVGQALLSAAEYGAFLVQFLRWWGAGGGGGGGGGQRGGTAAAAAAGLYCTHSTYGRRHDKPSTRALKDETAARCVNKCPVCLRPWRIPTALPVSGYVFCYVCVSRHLKAHHTCPVTKLPATHDQLIRLYGQ